MSLACASARDRILSFTASRSAVTRRTSVLPTSPSERSEEHTTELQSRLDPGFRPVRCCAPHPSPTLCRSLDDVDLVAAGEGGSALDDFDPGPDEALVDVVGLRIGQGQDPLVHGLEVGGDPTHIGLADLAVR